MGPFLVTPFCPPGSHVRKERCPSSRVAHKIKSVFMNIVYNTIVNTALFFVVLSLWFLGARCAEQSVKLFHIPYIWSRCADSDVASGFRWMPKVMPSPLRQCSVEVGEKSDKIYLRSHNRVATCTVRHSNVLSAESILSICVEGSCGKHYQEGFVFTRRYSHVAGGIILAPPIEKPPIEGHTPFHKFSLNRSQAPERFCQYLAEKDCFTVHRLLRTYLDETDFFVDVKFWYRKLDNVQVSYGTQVLKEDGTVSTEAKTVYYTFKPCAWCPTTDSEIFLVDLLANS